MLLVTCVSWDLESTCLHYCMFVLHISIHQCSVMHMTHVPSAPPSLPGSSKHCCMMGQGMRHSPPMRSGLLWICCLVEFGCVFVSSIQTPLMCASCKGHVECMKVLLDKGAQVNVQNLVSTALDEFMICLWQGHLSKDDTWEWDVPSCTVHC